MWLKHFVENIKAYQFFWIAMVLSGLCAVFRILPPDDVFGRYAPAAEAFARGDWQYAFHPRFGVWFTACAGSFVWLFRCSGVAACQLVSMLFFSLTVFPLHALFKKLWGGEAACWGTLCYVFCSHLLRYAGEGMRDNGKTLALALIALAILSLLTDTSWKNVFMLSGGTALLTVIRGEGCLIALTYGIIAVFLLRDWKKILVGTGFFLLLIAPQCIYNYSAIGYFVPELRHGVMLQDLSGISAGDILPEEEQ